MRKKISTWEGAYRCTGNFAIGLWRLDQFFTEGNGQPVTISVWDSEGDEEGKGSSPEAELPGSGIQGSDG